MKKEEEKRINTLEFEDALKELESIVKELESQSCTLSKNIELYEKGTLLKHRCIKLLDSAEVRIKEIEAIASSNASSDIKE